MYLSVTGILYFLHVDQILVFRLFCVFNHSPRELEKVFVTEGVLTPSPGRLEALKLPDRLLCRGQVPTSLIIKNSNDYDRD